MRGKGNRKVVSLLAQNVAKLASPSWAKTEAGGRVAHACKRGQVKDCSRKRGSLVFVPFEIAVHDGEEDLAL